MNYAQKTIPDLSSGRNNGNLSAVHGIDQFIPPLVTRSGNKAAKRFTEFFAVTIRNNNTREAYYRACRRFLEWCADIKLTDISSIEPLHVAVYIEYLGRTFSRPTVKQHLAAIRMLLDWLTVGQVLAGNPAISVRGPKHYTRRGTTPTLSPAEIRQLLYSIDTSTIIGLRDRALISLMVFSFARVSAALGMRMKDYFLTENRRWIGLQEKGGTVHEMPVHRTLEEYMDLFLDHRNQVRLDNEYVFKAANASDELLPKPMDRISAYRMVKRRAENAGISSDICCHSFRASGITIYLNNGGTLEKAQAMAGHKSPQTTKIYDRTSDAVTIREIERIVI